MCILSSSSLVVSIAVHLVDHVDRGAEAEKDDDAHGRDDHAVAMTVAVVEATQQ